MYFCTAGKDRTGVVSALLLKRLGVSQDVIVEGLAVWGVNFLCSNYRIQIWNNCIDII